MKTIKEFEKENKQLAPEALITIHGGETSSKTYEGTDGCTHYYTDEFEDCNGDGEWQQGSEPGTSCEEIIC
ncbi:hypothetical protein [Gilvibacter sp.]|uniref:hypothetical protein n=1 Tax=Gilvibacter sp. TaxID=2729997 RepID=UPI003B51F685